MGFKDPHDPREFRRFAQCDAKGNVIALVEVADSAPDPVNTSDVLHVDVSALGKVDLTSVAAQALLAPLIQSARAKPLVVEKVDGGQ